MPQTIEQAIADLTVATAAALETVRLAGDALKAVAVSDNAAALAALTDAKNALEGINTSLTAAMAGGSGSGPVVATGLALSLNEVTRAADALDRWGAVTHFNYTDGKYLDYLLAIEALNYLGFRHFRDTNLRPEDQGQNHLRAVVAAGLSITAYLRTDSTPAESLARLLEFAKIRSDALETVEGFNEINHGGIGYKSKDGEEAAQLFMEEFYTLAKADSLLKNVPIAGFTNWPPSVSKSDLATIHPYDKQGAQPRATMVKNMEDQWNAVGADGRQSDKGKAMIITETGYHCSTPAPAADWEAVDEVTHAKLLLNTLVVALSLGVSRTFIYQLFDDRPGDSQEQHFGLYNVDLTPKPAAKAIHNLTSLLQDVSLVAKTFVPRQLNLSVSPVNPLAPSFVVEKVNGQYLIVVWGEEQCWDHVGHKPVTAPIIDQEFDLGKSFAKVEVFDPLFSPEPFTTLTNASVLLVAVSDHPLVIRLTP